ncbi:MAG: 1-acyl-sn-glycerol-3-phosphate acyltransferase [Hydrococcus sp. C42_A2020_068]|nr:1-acyl-sn-glycerol-3-phosphate acyltransferase [Hydrococcus sp. C42_A2020_068]
MSYDLTKTSLPVSQSLLGAMGMRMFVYHEDRIPQEAGAVVVVSNHRSFMDAPILIQALRRPVRVACHRYMGQTPILKEAIDLLGCIPLDEPKKRGRQFFERATRLLQSRQWVGIFPEGASPMIQLTQPREMRKFQRGFAHLALRASVPDLAVLPVAIASEAENIALIFPVRLLRLFDPSEPLFNGAGWHPVLVYRHANVLIGRPYWITARHRQQYQGGSAKQVVTELTDYCRQEIAQLLQTESS